MKRAKSEKRAIGDIGEEVACKYLISRGFTIVDRNYLRPWGEIDIVAKNKELLVFVEVKSVSRGTSQALSRGTIRPEENMHPAKIMRLSRVVQTYLIDRSVPESQLWRVDLACVYLDFERKKGKVEVIENVI